MTLPNVYKSYSNGYIRAQNISIASDGTATFTLTYSASTNGDHLVCTLYYLATNSSAAIKPFYSYTADTQSVTAGTYNMTLDGHSSNDWGVYLEFQEVTSSDTNVFSVKTSTAWLNTRPQVGCSFTQPTSSQVIVAGTATTISGELTDANTSIQSFSGTLYRGISSDGNTWTWTSVQTLGTSGSFSVSDTIPTNTSGQVKWKVEATDGYKTSSGTDYYEFTTNTYTISDNVQPTAPASITATPASVSEGGSVTVTWGASTDTNLKGYRLQMSYDGGNEWATVYEADSTTTLTTTVTAPSISTSNSLLFRVQGYDTYSLASDWKVLSTAIVLTHNHAPSVPSYVSAPVSVSAGGSALVSWGASTDEDGDSVTYQLQNRYYTGTTAGEWTTVTASTSAVSYTVTIAAESYSKVQFRVRAYDGSAYSDWKEQSSTSTVLNNNAPTISALTATEGTDTSSNKILNIAYTYRDIDGDIAHTYVYIDSTQIATGGTQSSTAAITGATTVAASAFLLIANGAHTVTFAVVDAAGNRTERSVTYTKNVSGAIFSNTTTSLAAQANRITDVLMSMTGNFAWTDVSSIAVCNNYLDTSPTWETQDTASTPVSVKSYVQNGSRFSFANTTKTASNWAFGYKVTFVRASGSTGGSVTSVQGVLTIAS